MSALAHWLAERSCGSRVRLRRKTLHLVFGAAVLAASFGLCPDTSPRFSVTWVDARLSVSADAAPLSDLLREVVRQTGVVIVGLDRVEGAFSGTIVDRPLVDALGILLADHDHLIAGRFTAIHGGDVRVWLSPRSGGGTAASAPLSVADGPDVAPAADDLGTEDAAETDAAETATPDETELSRLEASGFFDDAAPSLLADAAHAADAAVRAKAVRVLTERDPAMAVDVLTGAMSDTSGVVRSAAAEMLESVDGPAVQDGLGSLLEHADPVVRYTALELLRRRAADPRVLPYLQQALGDENEAVRLTAEGLVKELESRTRTGGSR